MCGPVGAPAVRAEVSGDGTHDHVGGLGGDQFGKPGPGDVGAARRPQDLPEPAQLGAHALAVVLGVERTHFGGHGTKLAGSRTIGESHYGIDPSSVHG